jgi:hypothetical protein
MKKIIKIALYALLVISFLASIVGNGYYFGYKQLEANLLQKGFNIAVGQIVQSVQQTGQVQLSENMVLIQKLTETK